MYSYGTLLLDTWEWIWDPFWSVTMYSNGTLLLDVLFDAPLDAQCGYALSGQCSNVLVLLKLCKISVSARFCGVCVW